MATVTCSTRLGPYSAASFAAWAGSDALRSATNWIPRPDEDWMRDGKPTRRFFLFMSELSRRMGGEQGKSIAQVESVITGTQAEVLAVGNFTQQLGQYAQSVAATTNAIAQVAVDNALSGASSVPPTSSPPRLQPSQYEP